MSDPSTNSRREFVRRALLSAALWTRPFKVQEHELSTSTIDQDWVQQVSALRPSDQTAAEDMVLYDLQERAAACLASVPHAQSAVQADATRTTLRQKLASSLGINLFPWPPDLRPRPVGTLRFEGYRIEKLVYQTYPGSQAPAHLYVPDSHDHPLPAIIFYTGHWWPDSKSRPDFQSFCINMARRGFVVLSWDPFGQGERGVSTRDHRRDEGLLVGIAQQGFAEYETQCALEYLLSRPEVDKQRIGITGASGGGYNSWITASLDDRIAVAVPVVGTSDFYEQICTARLKDWYHAVDHCHFIPSLIRFANNHEYLSMIAPRPLLIVAAFGDEGFAVSGGREIHSYGQKLYRSYDAAEKIGLFVDSFDAHGYQQHKREAAYGWFLRWLKGEGDGQPVPERFTQTLAFDCAELRCFPPGQNQPAGPGMMQLVFDLAKRLPPPQASPNLDAVLGSLPMPVPLKPQLARARAQRLEILSEPWIKVPAFLLRPDAPAKGVLIGIDDRGKESLASQLLIRNALAKGWAVCGMDFRGLGELATSKMEWVSAVSLLLGANFIWRQAWDVRRVIDYLAGCEPFSTLPFALYARGHNSMFAATYALAQPESSGLARIRSVVLGDGFVSIRQFLDRPKSLGLSYALLATEPDKPEGYDREIPFWYFVFNALRSFDLPQLLASAKARTLVVNPLDGDWNRMPEREVRKILPWANVEVLSEDAPEERISQFLQLN